MGNGLFVNLLGSTGFSDSPFFIGLLDRRFKKGKSGNFISPLNQLLVLKILFNPAQ